MAAMCINNYDNNHQPWGWVAGFRYYYMHICMSSYQSSSPHHFASGSPWGLVHPWNASSRCLWCTSSCCGWQSPTDNQTNKHPYFQTSICACFALLSHPPIPLYSTHLLSLLLLSVLSPFLLFILPSSSSLFFLSPFSLYISSYLSLSYLYLCLYFCF